MQFSSPSTYAYRIWYSWRIKFYLSVLLMFRMYTLYYHLHVLRSVGRSHVNSGLMICHVSFSSCLFLSGKMVNLKHSLTIPVNLLWAYVVMYIHNFCVYLDNYNEKDRHFVFEWVSTLYERTHVTSTCHYACYDRKQKS